MRRASHRDINPIKTVRRISPLAIIFIALAAVLALHRRHTPRATWRLSSSRPDVAGYAAKATASGEVVVAPRRADFTQRRTRHGCFDVPLQPGRLQRCIRPPAGLSPDSGAPVRSAAARYARPVARASTLVGDGYTNVATGHYLTPPLCLFIDPRVRAQADVENGLGLDLVRWRLDTTF